VGWVAQIRNGLLERTIAGLDTIVALRGRGPDQTGDRAGEQPAHLLTGIEGEDAARSFLQRKGYIVVARRWSGGNLPGDLDLIAWLGPLLCFVEVKTRTAHDMAPAEAAIDTHKRKVLRRLARQYVRQLPDDTAPQIRFDVVGVYLLPGASPEFAHFENAFGWSEHRSEWSARRTLSSARS
jgi:putative endonuclease